MESVVSLTFPLAAIVIVLFLLWNDLLRRRRAMRVILFARSGLCLVLAGVLIFNWVTFRRQVEDLPLFFAAFAAFVSIIGAAWFFYRGIRGDARFVSQEEEPLPKIFDSSEKESREAPPSESDE